MLHQVVGENMYRFIKYMYGELELYKEFERDDLVTCSEVCECDRCSASHEWLNLPWYRKLLAKLFL